MTNKGVAIRPHLVTFLFKEMEGKEASYMDTKSKSIRIYSFSSFGKILYSQLSPATTLGRNEQFVLYLMIEKKKAFEFQGHIYIEKNNVYEILLLPEENIKNINNLLEDIFRMAFTFYVEGALVHSTKTLKEAIESFMDKYDLLELGFSVETLSRLFHREKSRCKKLQRFQHQSSNRVINYTMS